MRSTSSSPNRDNNKSNIIDFASARKSDNDSGIDSPETIIQMIDSGEITPDEYAAYVEYYGKDPIHAYDDVEPAEADSPKIKIETDESGINVYALGTTVIIAVGFAVFFCGIAFKLTGLSIIGVMAIALSILGAVFHYRTNAEAERRKRDKAVDSEVESFKLDLYKTLVGYDLHVSQEEIDKLVEQYRADRIAAETSFASLNPYAMLKMAISKTKETNQKDSKNPKKASKRKQKKAKEKAEKKSMEDALTGMSDDDIINAVTGTEK